MRAGWVGTAAALLGIRGFQELMDATLTRIDRGNPEHKDKDWRVVRWALW